jgi:hypothetical protein
MLPAILPRAPVGKEISIAVASESRIGKCEGAVDRLGFI